MIDKPDRKALAEQIRALVEQPHMQEAKRRIEALRNSRPANFAEIRDGLNEFSSRLRMQLGPRGQSGVEPTKPNTPAKRGRGRPAGPKYPRDAEIVLQIRAEMQRTGEKRVEAVAKRFADEADGGGTPTSRMTRLAKAYRAKFGRASDGK